MRPARSRRDPQGQARPAEGRVALREQAADVVAVGLGREDAPVGLGARLVVARGPQAVAQVAEHVELLGDQPLVLEREVDALGLRAVPECGVVEIEPLAGVRFALSPSR